MYLIENSIKFDAKFFGRHAWQLVARVHFIKKRRSFMKYTFFIAVLFSLNLAYGAPLVYDMVNCTQKCGLTPNTSETVRALVVGSKAAMASLADQCRWRNMALQGQPKCEVSRYDYSQNELAVRCNTHINSEPNLCRGTVDGVGKVPGTTQLVTTHSDKFSDTFSSALLSAFAECRHSFLSKGISEYRCDVRWYAPSR